MTKISKKTSIIFLISSIIGLVFLIDGIIANIRVLRFIEQNQYDPDWDSFDIYWSKFYSVVNIGIGSIIIILTIIVSLTYYLQAPSKVVEKKDYMDLEWLNHQYNELGMSFQDIAINQGVSMITVKKWVDRLPNSKK